MWSFGPEVAFGPAESRTSSLQFDPMAGLFQLHVAKTYLEMA